MGIIILSLLSATELFFMIWNIADKKNHAAEKSVANISEAALFTVMSIAGVIMWGFRYFGIAIALAAFAIAGAVTLIRKKYKPYKTSSAVLRTVGKIFIFVFAIIPALLFPQYKQPDVSGSYKVAQKTYVFTDTSRTEEFSDNGENRNVTVEVYYPEGCEEKCPLVVFSHGAFGYYESNYSTYAELVSNGYTVASINHPYHAFFDTSSYGRLITADPEILQKTTEFNGKDMSDEEFTLSHKWLKLRTDDMNFVVDTLKQEATGSDEILGMINTDKIGLMGHSLGGAASAELGRQRNDIAAVIDIDGTLIGDELAFKDGVVINNDEPYPIPMLDIFGENHYNEAQKYADWYVNLRIAEYSPNVRNVVMKGAGHLNLTDLPLFSPALAKMLGTGSVDRRYCIETMNTVVREYFDWQLKDAQEPQLKGEY